MEQSHDQQLWEKTLASLKEHLDEDSFSTWLRPTKLLAVEQNTVKVGVPSTFYKNWLQANYRDKILAALRQVASQDYNLDFHVSTSTDGDQALHEAIAAEAPAWTREALPVDSAIEAPKSSYLNPKYTFDHYVVGESNRFAHAACRQVADPISRSYNPLFIYGGVGLGKTHLMHAIGHQLVTINPRLRVLYVTSEQFMNSFIEAISQGKQFEFRDYYRNVDLLLIDDVQFFSGKERTQTEFFHTFNALYDAGKKIVVSSDRPPKELSALEDRLRNRFAWGLVVDIQAPDLETRIAILKKKAGSDVIDLPNEVTGFLAERVKSNIRELEGVLVRLKAYAALHKQPITLDLAKEVCGHLLDNSNEAPVNIDDVIEEVCQYFEIKRAELIGSSRLKKFSTPRHIGQYLARKLTPLSYPEIAEKFGGRDHTSILHAVRKIEEEADRDANLRNLLQYLSKRIRDQKAGQI